MITDDPQDMEQKLTQYVKDAREALDTLEELSPSNIIPTRPVAPGSEEERYTQALNKLNHARVWLGMAAEQLHDRLTMSTTGECSMLAKMSQVTSIGLYESL
jgi:hypothetical protein